MKDLKKATPKEIFSELTGMASLFSMYCENLDGNAEDDIRELVETANLEELLETAYEDYMDGRCVDGEATVNAFRKFIFCLNYLENETSIPTPVSDEVYDKISELLVDYDREQIIGNRGDVADRGAVKEHKYPELRGSLKKVHFCRKADVPKKDSRKSLEEYLASFFGKYKDAINDGSKYNTSYGILGYELINGRHI